MTRTIRTLNRHLRHVFVKSVFAAVFPVSLALFLCGAIAVSASAQSSGGVYRIERSVIAGGGATLAGGVYGLSGTFGQAQTATLSASNCRFYNGFWAPLSDGIFANGFDSCL